MGFCPLGLFPLRFCPYGIFFHWDFFHWDFFHWDFFLMVFYLTWDFVLMGFFPRTVRQCFLCASNHNVTVSFLNILVILFIQDFILLSNVFIAM